MTAFFTFYTERFGYECGTNCDPSSGWFETDYIYTTKGVSIIASSRPEDCLGVLKTDDWTTV